MPNKDSKFRTYAGLFMPSALSVLFCVFLAAATLIANQFSGIRSYLRLPDNLDIVHSVMRFADRFLNSVLGESRTDVLVVGIFWAFVGLVVYLFLRGLARYITELDDSIEVRRYIWPKGADRSKPLRVIVERTAFRIAALIALILIVVGPVLRTLKGPLFVDFLGPNKPLQYVVWFLCGLLLWHGVIILLRLVVLRARVVGNA